MDCSHCGTPLTTSSRFCPGCGLRIDGATPPPIAAEPPTVPAPPPPEPVSFTPPPPVPLPPPPVPGSITRPGLGGSGAKLAGWVAALVVVAALGVVGARRFVGSPAAATSPVPEPAPAAANTPEASCETESQLKSAPGSGEGMLQVTNKTTAPVVVHWLNLSGARERWFEVRPGGSRNQRTPPTYRWIVARPDGTCLAVVSGQGSVVVE